MRPSATQASAADQPTEPDGIANRAPAVGGQRQRDDTIGTRGVLAGVSCHMAAAQSAATTVMAGFHFNPTKALNGRGDSPEGGESSLG
jgi:hypothetical protein